MSRPRPLIVRLRNWVGDVTLGVPTLQRLHDAGYELQLVGKGWARDLLAGHGWPVHVLPKTWRERVALLHRLRGDARLQDPALDRRLNALCLPYSFSSALDFRLAGLRALGHAQEGRSPLLSRTLPRPRGLHELEVYWQIGSALLDASEAPPPSIGLRVSELHRERAQALRDTHGIEADCILICPFAGGTWAKQDKTWPGFAPFVQQHLAQRGRTVIVCPGPGEEDIARNHYPAARLVPDVDLGTYAALLESAALMVSNDTGPGHIAAAVGAPLVSVLGPSDPALWRAWGPSVTLVRGEAGWPDEHAVVAAVDRMLSAR